LVEIAQRSDRRKNKASNERTLGLNLIESLTIPGTSRFISVLARRVNV
jgi:hypothetical protein